MYFEDAFSTDQACFKYVFLVQGDVCPNCQSTQYRSMKEHTLRCKLCRKFTSVTQGTLIQVMWYMVCEKQGVSAHDIQDVLGIGIYETEWSKLHKFQKAMVLHGRDQLS